MALISWDQDIILNVEEMDIEHKQLFILVNNLRQAMVSPAGKIGVSKALTALIDFTRTHFATEERLMTTHSYPRYEQHKREHEALLQDVDQLLKLYHDGDALIPFAIELDLEAWAYKHIDGCDRDLAVYLNEQGIF